MVLTLPEKGECAHSELDLETKVLEPKWLRAFIEHVYLTSVFVKIELEICNKASLAKPNRNERRCAKRPNVDLLNKRVAKEG